MSVIATGQASSLLETALDPQSLIPRDEGPHLESAVKGAAQRFATARVALKWIGVYGDRGVVNHVLSAAMSPSAAIAEMQRASDAVREATRNLLSNVAWENWNPERQGPHNVVLVALNKRSCADPSLPPQHVPVDGTRADLLEALDKASVQLFDTYELFLPIAAGDRASMDAFLRHELKMRSVEVHELIVSDMVTAASSAVHDTTPYLSEARRALKHSWVTEGKWGGADTLYRYVEAATLTIATRALADHANEMWGHPSHLERGELSEHGAVNTESDALRAESAKALKGLRVGRWEVIPDVELGAEPFPELPEPTGLPRHFGGLRFSPHGTYGDPVLAMELPTLSL